MDEDDAAGLAGFQKEIGAFVKNEMARSSSPQPSSPDSYQLYSPVARSPNAGRALPVVEAAQQQHPPAVQSPNSRDSNINRRLPEALNRFFVVQSCDEVRMSAICVLCGTVVKSNIGVTSNLHRHLKLKHMEEVQVYFSWNVAPESNSTNKIQAPGVFPPQREAKETVRLSRILQKYFTVNGLCDNRLTLVCKLCGTHVKSNVGVTSNFHRHLKVKHVQEVQFENGALHSLALTALLEKSSVPSTSVPAHPKQEEWTKLLLQMVANDVLLLNSVDSETFRNFIGALAPSFKLSSRSAVVHKLQQCVQQEVLSSFRRAIQDIPNDCVFPTLDVWTSRSRPATTISCVRLHLISKEWELTRNTVALLHLGEDHAWRSIHEKLEMLLMAFNVGMEKVGGVMIEDVRQLLRTCQTWDTDYGSEDLTFFMGDAPVTDLHDIDPWSYRGAIGTNHNNHHQRDGGSEDDDDDYELQPTGDVQNGHRSPIAISSSVSTPLVSVVGLLQAALRDALDASELASTLLARIGDVVSYLTRILNLGEHMQLITGQSFFSSPHAHWIAQLEVLQRVCEVYTYSAISQLLQEVGTLSNGSIDPPSLVPEFREELVELLDVLSPISEAIESLQGDGVTSSLVIPAIKGIFTVLSNLTTVRLESFKHTLMSNLGRRMKETLSDKSWILATVLDPRFRLRPFNGEMQAPGEPSAAVVEHILQQEYSASRTEMLSSGGDEESGEQSPANSTSSERSFLDEKSIFSFLANGDNKRARTVSEVDGYLQDAGLSGADDPLLYWRINRDRYPRLALLARRYLAVPTASAPLQRLLSTTENVCSAGRAKINPLELETIVLYRENCMK